MLSGSNYCEFFHTYQIRCSNIINYCADHSYFEKVIEQLQQVAGAEQESHGDVSVDLTREEVELTPGTNVCFLFLYFLSLDNNLQ